MVEEERREGERDEDAPLVLREPPASAGRQDERNETPAGERKSRKGVGGPNTAAGKAVVARNPIKHGVLAQTPVLPLVESQEEWERLRQDVLDWFGLEEPFQESLGERVATLIWRLKRAARAETEATRHYQDDVPEDWKSSMRMEGLPIADRKTRDRVKEEFRMLMARLLPGDETMDKILRYESKLHRYLLQTIYMILVVKGAKQVRSGRFYGVAELDPPEVSKRMGLPPGGGS